MPTITLSDGGTMRLTEERMRELAAYLVRLQQQGEDERDALEADWQQSRSDYNNEPIPFISKIIKGVQDMPQNFAQPRADALSDFVISSIASQSPLVTCLDAQPDPFRPPMPPPQMQPGLMPDPMLQPVLPPDPGQDNRQEHRQITMDFLLRRGQLGEALKTISVNAWCTNHGILRMSYGGPENPLQFDPIDPEDFICVGSGAYDIHESRCVGHRYQRARGDLKLGQKAKRYAESIDIDELGVATTEESERDTPVGGTSASTDEDLITLWQLYVILDPKGWNDDTQGPLITGKERRFSVVLEPESMTILRIEEYEYRHLCYFSFGYKAPPVKGFWHPRSVGADMQGPHRSYNCIANAKAYGSLMAAFPPLVAQHGAFAKDQRYGYGEVVEMEAGDLMVPVINFKASDLDSELMRTERIGDSVARINSAGIAQESQQAKTATQSNNEAAGMRAGIGGYLETFTNPIPRMCEHADEILADTFADWKPMYGENTPVKSPKDLTSRVRWDVPGKIPNLNPQVVVQNGQTIMGLLGSLIQLPPQMQMLGLELLKLTMNAMDLPVDKLMAALQPPPGGMSAGQPGQPGAGMVGGVDGQSQLGPVQGGMAGPTGPMAQAA